MDDNKDLIDPFELFKNVDRENRAEMEEIPAVNDEGLEPDAEEPESDAEATVPDAEATVPDGETAEPNLPTAPEKRKKAVIPIWVFVGAGVVFVAAALIALAVRIMNAPNTTRVNINEYLEIGEDEKVLYLNMQKMETNVELLEGEYYLSNTFLQENMTDKFYYDAGLEAMLFTTQDTIFQIPFSSANYLEDGVAATFQAEGREVAVAVRSEGDIYISLSFVMEYVGGYSCCIYEEPTRIYIYEGDVTREYVRFVEKTATVRAGTSDKSYIVAEYDPENEEGSESGIENWYITDADIANIGWMMVKNDDGRYGYVKSEQLEKSTVKRTMKASEKLAYENLLRDHDILLGWHGVYDPGDNTHVKELVERTNGMNVISPTWYKVSDNLGNVDSFADDAYVAYVQEQGIEIWPLISDFNFPYNEEMDEATFLKSYESRTHLIAIMVQEAKDHGYNGWNIDFEHVPTDCGYDYIEFIRELSIACRKNNLVLSVDNYVTRSWNGQYMRADQGECIDYFIVMGYDEHYAGGDTAGSTASINFVTEGVDLALEEVPVEKLIMGVPFYTRLWKTDEAGTLTSTAYTMIGAKNIVAELGLEPVWDDTVCQNVASGTVNGILYQIWMEDSESMRVRVTAIRKREVAGLAAWSLGYEEENVWKLLKKD